MVAVVQAVVDSAVAVVHYIIRIMQLAQEQVVVELRQNIVGGSLGNNRDMMKRKRAWTYELQTKSN